MRIVCGFTYLRGFHAENGGNGLKSYKNSGKSIRVKKKVLNLIYLHVPSILIIYEFIGSFITGGILFFFGTLRLMLS